MDTCVHCQTVCWDLEWSWMPQHLFALFIFRPGPPNSWQLMQVIQYLFSKCPLLLTSARANSISHTEEFCLVLGKDHADSYYSSSISASVWTGTYLLELVFLPEWHSVWHTVFPGSLLTNWEVPVCPCIFSFFESQHLLSLTCHCPPLCSKLNREETAIVLREVIHLLDVLELSLFMSSLPIIESNCAVDTDGVDLTNFVHHVNILLIQVSGSALRWWWIVKY